MTARVTQVSMSPAYTFTKPGAAQIRLLAGQIGENILTEGIDLHALPTGTSLQFGKEARIEVTGLRNPCMQLTDVHPELLSHLAFRDAEGQLVRRAGIMAIVTAAGDVKPGDPIAAELPPLPHRPLERV